MERFLSAIQDWPVLVQGAVGSGIFWLFLLLGQKVTAFCSNQISARSKEKRKSDLLTRLLRFQALGTTADGSGAFYASILWYRASRSLIKALMWLTLGLIFNAVMGVLGVVGFIGCLYYLFAAFDVVRPLNYEGDIDEKIKELEQQLEELDGI